MQTLGGEKFYEGSNDCKPASKSKLFIIDNLHRLTSPKFTRKERVSSD
jgi:hypothetical protein